MSQMLSYGASGPLPGQYYRHSGKVTFHGVAIAAAIGFPIAILVGVAYAYGDMYIPIVQLNALVCGAFGLAVGFLCGKVLVWGKVRNLPVSLTLIGLLTLVAYYVSWVAWTYGTLRRFDVDFPFSMVDLAFNPKLLWTIIEDLNDVGTWSLGRSSKSNVSGTFLWVIWTIEAATIFIASFWVGKVVTGERPFCETCQQWIEQPKVLTTLAAGDQRMAKASVEVGDYSYLQERKQEPLANPWWQLEYRACKGCGRMFTLTLKQITRTLDKKGKESLGEKVIMNRLVISTEQLQALAGAMGVADPTSPAQPS